MADSCMKCELRVIAAKNIETNPKCKYFVRCYISKGNNNTSFQVNTSEIMSTKLDEDCVFWNDSFSLECNGAQNSINNLKEDNIVFELRWRDMMMCPSFLGQHSGGGSHLYARAEISWKNVFDALGGMETLNWVPMTRAEKVKCEKNCTMPPPLPPALQVGIKVETLLDLSTNKMSSEEMKKRRRLERLKNRDECGCSLSNGGCCSCVDNELLLVAESLNHF